MERFILQGEEYDEIEETVTSLFEDLGFTSFPVDCWEVASRLKIDLKKYSEVSKEDKDMLVAKFEDGYGSCLGKYRYAIYYNDEIDSDRIKFTIWYEIGHIQLGHYDNCKKSQQQMKAEANHFAVFAQAPMPAVILSKPKDEYDISSTFDLSLECAENVFSTYKKVTYYSSIVRKIMDKRILQVLDFSKVRREKICG